MHHGGLRLVFINMNLLLRGPFCLEPLAVDPNTITSSSTWSHNLEIPAKNKGVMHEHCKGNLEFQRLQLQYGNLNTTIKHLKQ